MNLEAEAAALADSDRLADVDLDDQTPAMGDSVHTYLKSIGRTSLLTAEQEVDLAKRIEAGPVRRAQAGDRDRADRGLPA